MSSHDSGSDLNDMDTLLSAILTSDQQTKAQTLKTILNLAQTSPKIVSLYTKRLYSLATQLLAEKEEISLLYISLLMEIMSFTQKQLQFNIRTKIITQLVINLGSQSPSLRKSSHHCLLALVKKFNRFDELLGIYLENGMKSKEWQLKQKTINSFQSVFLSQTKSVNWKSNNLKALAQEIIQGLYDENAWIKKACEQSLVSICKCQQVRTWSKGLPEKLENSLKKFCIEMKEKGNLIHNYLEVKAEVMEDYKLPNLARNQSSNLIQAEASSQNNLPINSGYSPTPKLSLISQIQQIRRQIQTPFVQPKNELKLRKAQSVSTVSKRIDRKDYLPSLRKSVQMDIIKNETPELVMDKKMLEDLKNEKDWKVRLSALQELQLKLSINKSQSEQLQYFKNNFLPILLKLLNDQNFKISLLSLKILQQLLESNALQSKLISTQIAQKLNDAKLSLRQNVSRLILAQYMRKNDKIWVDQIMIVIEKGGIGREQAITILTKMINQQTSIESLQTSLVQIINVVCSLMEDQKTKNKIKALDLLILLTIKATQPHTIKQLVHSKVNQIYYEMYLQKLPKYSLPAKSIMKIKSKQAPQTQNNKANFGHTTSSSLGKKPMNSQFNGNTTAKTMLFISKNVKQPEMLTRTSLLRTYRKNKLKQTNSSSFSNFCLDPLTNPETEIKSLLKGLKSQDWQTCSASLTTLRRAIMYHPEYLTQPLIRSFIPQIAHHVQSLRSSLSRNAVITMGELAQKFGKWLQNDLEVIYNKLTKKTLETNEFLSEQVEKSLVLVCTNCNMTKIINLLMQSFTTKSIPIKLSIITIIQNLFSNPKAFEKELERLMLILVTFIGEGALQIRERSKRLIGSLLTSQRRDQVKKFIPKDILIKFESIGRSVSVTQKVENFQKPKVIQKVATLQVSNEIINIQKLSNPEKPEQLTQKKLPNRRQIKQKPSIAFPSEFNLLEQLLLDFSSSDNKTRLKSLQILSTVIIQPFPIQFSQHKLFSKTMQVVIKLISDPNLKVSLAGLKIIRVIVKKDNQNGTCYVPGAIEGSLALLVNQVFNCFGSSRAEIRDTADVLMREIEDSVEKWTLVQHMCNGILYSTQKSRPTILTHLLTILPFSLQKSAKRSNLTKALISLTNKLADEGKPQLKDGLAELMRICFTLLQNEYLEGINNRAAQIWRGTKAM